MLFLHPLWKKDGAPLATGDLASAGLCGISGVVISVEGFKRIAPNVWMIFIAVFYLTDEFMAPDPE